VNADALSDLILAVLCAWIAWREGRARPGVALGIGIVGVAGVLGVLRFSGLEWAKGPHTFFSTVSACAGLPLLAVALCWPGGSTARESRAAARFLLIAGTLSIAITAAAGFSLWRQIAPGAAGVLILYAAVLSRAPLAVIGALLLTASFAVTATGFGIGPLNSTQGLHYLMAAAFVLLTRPVAVRVTAKNEIASAV
jgi:hypothetical protein